MKLKGLVAYLSPVWAFGESPKHETVTELNQSSTSQSGIRHYWNGPQNPSLVPNVDELRWSPDLLNPNPQISP